MATQSVIVVTISERACAGSGTPLRDEMRKIISNCYADNTEMVTTLLENEDIRNDLCEAMMDNVIEALA